MIEAQAPGGVTEPLPKQKVAAAQANPGATTAPPSYDEEDDMGEGMTRVRVGPAPQPPTEAIMAEEPVVTNTRAPQEPSQSLGVEVSTVHGDSVAPDWVKRVALVDTDSDRTAARERMQAIDSELLRLAIERPTTLPLREAAGDPGDGNEVEAPGDGARTPE
jgi:hypothetical protein